VPDETASDKRLELAYDAGEKKLAMQDSTLGNVRTRANNLLAVAALFTSFAAGLGLINTDPTHGPVISSCAAIMLLVVVMLLGVTVLYVIWPAKDWAFVPSARKIMDRYREGQSEDAIREYVIGEMIVGGNKNARALDEKQVAFRIAVILLVVEVALLLMILVVK
jgi:hypothetical protein